MGIGLKPTFKTQILGRISSEICDKVWFKIIGSRFCDGSIGTSGIAFTLGSMPVSIVCIDELSTTLATSTLASVEVREMGRPMPQEV